MFSLTLLLIVQWPFSTLRGNFRLIRLENVSFPFPSLSNMPCHDLGHMLGVLHHLRRFLSKIALIPNGPISLQLTFIFYILIVPHRLNRALWSLDQSLFLYSPPHGTLSQSPLWRLQSPSGSQAQSLLILFNAYSAQVSGFTCLEMRLGSYWVAA